jgi:hypothetical protein
MNDLLLTPLVLENNATYFNISDQILKLMGPRDQFNFSKFNYNLGSGGDFGCREDKINELLKKMI